MSKNVRWLSLITHIWAQTYSGLTCKNASFLNSMQHFITSYTVRKKNSRKKNNVLAKKLPAFFLLKEYLTQKWTFCHLLLTLISFQTCVSFFLMLNMKIFWRTLVMKQFLSPLTYSIYFPTMEVSGDQQLFGFQNSSKYLLLCSTWNSYRFRTAWGWVKNDNISFSFLGELFL